MAKVMSAITGNMERSTIRDGIADADLFCMFGCIKVKNGKLSLIVDGEGNIHGREDNDTTRNEPSPGELLEAAYRRKGGVKPFINNDKAIREERMERMAAMHAERVANGFDENSMDIEEGVSVFDAL